MLRVVASTQIKQYLSFNYHYLPAAIFRHRFSHSFSRMSTTTTKQVQPVPSASQDINSISTTTSDGQPVLSNNRFNGAKSTHTNDGQPNISKPTKKNKVIKIAPSASTPTATPSSSTSEIITTLPNESATPAETAANISLNISSLISIPTHATAGVVWRFHKFLEHQQAHDGKLTKTRTPETAFFLKHSLTLFQTWARSFPATQPPGATVQNECLDIYRVLKEYYNYMNQTPKKYAGSELISIREMKEQFQTINLFPGKLFQTIQDLIQVTLEVEEAAAHPKKNRMGHLNLITRSVKLINGLFRNPINPEGQLHVNQYYDSMKHLLQTKLKPILQRLIQAVGQLPKFQPGHSQPIVEWQKLMQRLPLHPFVADSEAVTIFEAWKPYFTVATSSASSSPSPPQPPLKKPKLMNPTPVGTASIDKIIYLKQEDVRKADLPVATSQPTSLNQSAQDTAATANGQYELDDEADGDEDDSIEDEFVDEEDEEEDEEDEEDHDQEDEEEEDVQMKESPSIAQLPSTPSLPSNYIMAPSKLMQLNSELDHFYQSRRLSPADLDARDGLLMRLTKIVQIFNPAWSCVVFGSSASGLALKASDMDVAIVEKSGQTQNHMLQQRAREIMSQLVRLLRRRSDQFTRIQPIISARVPIIKLQDKRSGVQVDLSIGSATRAFKSNLLSSYTAHDERVAALITLVKAWSSANDLNDASKGTLNSFGYTLLVLQYLQIVRPQLLPSFQQSIDAAQSPETKNFVSSIPGILPFSFQLHDPLLAEFMKLDESAQGRYFIRTNPVAPATSSSATSSNSSPVQTSSSPSLGELLLGFFYFYGHVFDSTRMGVCIRTGHLCDKSIYSNFIHSHPNPNPIVGPVRFGRNGRSRANKPPRIELLIIDPFDIHDNVARGITSDVWRMIVAEMRRACAGLLATGSFARICEPIPHGHRVGGGGGKRQRNRKKQQQQQLQSSNHLPASKTKSSTSAPVAAASPPPSGRLNRAARRELEFQQRKLARTHSPHQQQ